MMVYQMRLRRYYRAFREVVAFDCAAAYRDEARLVSFYRFDTVEGQKVVLSMYSIGE